MKIQTSYKTNILLFILSAIFVSAIVYTQPIIFNANDNIGILKATENNLEVPFISYALRIVLSYLYVNISDDVPWYSLFLYSVHIISIALFFITVFSIPEVRRYVLPIITLYLIVYAGFILQVGYNNAGIMIGANALFSFIVLLQKKHTISINLCITLGLLFSLSYLIRTPLIQALVVFSMPVIIFSLIHGVKNKQIKYLFIYFLIPVIVILSNNLIESQMRSETYNSFSEFNKVRGKLHEFPILSANKNNTELLNLNEWTETDYKTLQNWLHLDEKKFNYQTLSNIHKYPIGKMSIWVNLQEKLYDFLSDYKNMLAMFLLPALLLLRKDVKTGIIIPILFYQAYVIFGMVYMIVEYRFPTRIGIPIFLSCTTFLIYLITANTNLNNHFKNTGIKSSRYIEAWLFIIFLSFSVWNLMLLFETKNKIISKRAEFSQLVKIINDLPSNSFILVGAGGLANQYMNPLGTYNGLYNNNIISTGWAIFSPMFYDEIGNIGVTKGSELLPKMYGNKNAYLLIPKKRNDVFFEIAKQELGNDVCLEHVVQLPTSSQIYRLRKNSKCYSDNLLTFNPTKYNYREIGRYFSDFDGEGRAIRARKNEKGIIFSSPPIYLPAGDYRAVINSPGNINVDELIKLEVISELDERSPQDYNIKEISVSNDILEVHFHLDEHVAMLKLNVISLGVDRVVIKHVSINKLPISDSAERHK